MKKTLLVLLLVGIIGFIGCSKVKEVEAREFDPCETKLAGIFNECHEVNTTPNTREEFDYGVYLHMILFESKDDTFSLGLWNTWETQREEFTTLIGGTIYFNRMFWQKKD